MWSDSTSRNKRAQAKRSGQVSRQWLQITNEGGQRPNESEEVPKSADVVCPAPAGGGCKLRAQAKCAVELRRNTLGAWPGQQTVATNYAKVGNKYKNSNIVALFVFVASLRFFWFNTASSLKLRRLKWKLSTDSCVLLLKMCA